MKKTLAIVLALVMVLALIPAMSAGTVKTVNDKSYGLKIASVGGEKDANGNVYAVDKLGELINSITFEYNYEDLDADSTSKWTEDAKVAYVKVKGFDADIATVDTIYIDGKVLDVPTTYNIYGVNCGWDAADQSVKFPVELTKAGYTDTYLVQVVGKNAAGTETITETAKITVVLKNTAAYKGAETATITNIVSETDDMSAYIVGSKIYFDFIDDAEMASAKITFADENGKAFNVITYAYNPVVKQADGSYAEETTVASTVGAVETKLDKSAAEFDFNADGKTVKFLLETKAANYETKAYTIKVREDIKPEDPKGIYFAENTKTIAMGETFAPVVMGVKTGKPVDADIYPGAKTDLEVIDIVDNKVVGTREGVAYITATYKVPGDEGEAYLANAMKIIVTLPGESIPEVDPSAEIYYVTCRALNVRAGAGTSYKKVDLIHRGDAVKVVELKNGWAKLDDGTYVCAKYIAK